MVEDEEEDFEEDDYNDEEVKKEKEELQKLGVSDTWNLLTKPGSKKKEEKRSEYKGFG
jgi:hypothetical protein